MAHRSWPDDDGDLVARCLADDADAWHELVTRHRAALVDLAARMLPRGDAMDLVDGVISDLWRRRKLAQYQHRSSLRTWLGAVVVNASLNARRSERARPDGGSTGLDEETEALAPSAAESNELALVLHDAIATLSPGLKALVLFYYEQQLSLDDISRIVGSSKSTLSRNLRSAREAICAAAERIAADRGTTLAALRRGVDLSQLDLDLRAACSTERHRRTQTVSKR